MVIFTAKFNQQMEIQQRSEGIGRKILRYVRSPVVTLLIISKWVRDKRVLPLYPEHFELYYNIHRLTWRQLNRFPNLISCRDFNDHIQWLKLFDQSEQTIKCSDKLLMREYVLERAGVEYLPRLYQICDRFDEIKFEELPDSFVIKTNHDSGSVFIVKEKALMDVTGMQFQLEKALKRTYGWSKGEWAYSYINPKILVEEFIATDGNNSPPDYKFHCVNGEVKWLQYIFDRGVQTKEVILDAGGEMTSIHFNINSTQARIFEKPVNWDRLKKIIEAIASGWKYVRVDAYNVNGKIYIGELTFFPLSGCYKGLGQKKLGVLMNFDRSTYKNMVTQTKT